MTLTFSEIEVVLSEIRSLIIEGILREVQQIDADTIILKFYSHHVTSSVLICVREGFSRIHLISKEKKSEIKTPSPFLMKLRKEIIGGRVRGLKLLYNDRVICFYFLRSGWLFHLLFECSGHHPNLFLLDSNFRIISMFKKSKSFKRDLTIGKVYERPIPLKEAQTEVMRFLQNDKSISAQIEEFFDERERENLLMKRVKNIKDFIKSSLRHEENKKLKIEEDLERSKNFEKMKEAGEAILLNLKNIKKGDEKLIINGKEINLDPSKTPCENAEWYFEKYKKLKNALPIIEERLKKCIEKNETYKEYLLKIKEKPVEEVLNEIENALRKEGFKREKEKKIKKERLPYLEFIARDGSKIFVGRNARDNEILTWKIARGKDIFFHTTSFSGSHVILCRDKKEYPGREAIEDASLLSSFFSKGKKEKTIEVSYTECKNLRKSKYGKKGSVRIIRSQTICVNPQCERLKELLAQKKC